MKKIIVNIVGLIALIAIVSSCQNPMADIVSSLDSAQAVTDANFLAKSDLSVAPAAYTLTEDDYALSSNESVAKYQNFSASIPADEFIPEIINKLFFAGSGTEMDVTYNYYYPLKAGTYVAYTVTDADYTATSHKYGNFSAASDITGFLAYKYPDAVRNDAVELTYDYYENHNTDTRSSKAVFDGTNWLVVYAFTKSDYNNMEQKYSDFGAKSDAEFYIPLYLPSLFPYAKGGDIKFLEYEVYKKGGNDVYDVFYQFDGQAWSAVKSVIQATMKFKYDDANSTWVVVPPIKFIKSDKANTREYTLTDADFELVGNGKYHNFDVRAGNTDEDEQVRIDKISTILKADFNDLAVGDVFLVHYAVYSGSNEVWDLTLEAVEDTGK